MLSNSETKITSGSSTQEYSPKIWVQPEDKITFLCSKNQTVGIIKIHIQSFSRRLYQFQIKTTNKYNYKVSQPNGIINKSPYTIYIYLRQVNSLQRTLSDKFKVSVYDTKKMKTVFSSKYGVIIQSNLHSLKEEILTDSNSTSKGVSIYTSPSILGGQSNMTKKSSLSVLRMSHIDSHVALNKQKVSTYHQEKTTLRQKLNQSILVLEKGRRKQAHLQKQIRNKKAKQRFTIYIFIFFIITSFFIGIYAKNLSQFQKQKVLKKQAESKFFYFF